MKAVVWPGLALAFAVAACADGPEAVSGPTAPRLLASEVFEQCPVRHGEAFVQEVLTTHDWQALGRQVRQTTDRLDRWAPRFDAREAVFVVSQGLRPRSGHTLQVGPLEEIYVGDVRVLRVPVIPVGPPEGSLGATVMTSPCLVGWVRFTGFDALRVGIPPGR